ncbi:Na/Pi symporter [Methylomonas sp. SURF-2]|uniref:Na/Pi symporter n=1 Tax=Methylomonas subterranea TaxID=2952225 RepID=A0ABT1TBJ0_9GAMM|nr:Na/Pi symporter [Methylomonas sp. SURF-2]MCQ8102616.1 Na/Pi symporter [Methylomonas sp. SURF-2]
MDNTIKHSLFVLLFALLGLGFWLSADFKTIVAGIAVFVFGMLSLQKGFKFFTGGVLERLLRNATDNMVKRLLFGIVTTTLMQSSSLLSVLVISFISAGLLDLTAGIGIIFGANIGTTTGAWLVAGFGLKVNISGYAMPLLVFGVLLHFAKRKSYQGVGHILLGLGFLFLGIQYMKDGLDAFKGNIDLSQFAMTGLSGLLTYVLLGIAVTVVIQASGATMVLIIAALASHQISYENALALAVGSNLGTTITAVLGAFGANIKGKRLAGAHVLFNLFTGVLAIVFLRQFIWLVDWLCDYAGIAPDDYTLKLAMFHSVFNVVGVVVMLPLSGLLARLLETFMREKTASVELPRFLTKSALQYPDTAVESVHQETRHLYENVTHVILRALGLHRRDVYSGQDLTEVIGQYPEIKDYDIDDAYERNIKGLYSAIIEFVSQARFTWEMKQSGRLYWLREANLKLVEAVKAVKHLQKNLLKHHRSYNRYQAEEYDRIRFQIAFVIRELRKIKDTEQVNELPLLTLDALKGRIKEQRQAAIEIIENLIRERKISAEAGTSLLNDSSYVYEIQSNLIRMAETVFINHAADSVKAEKELALTDHEMLAVIRPTQAVDHE